MSMDAARQMFERGFMLYFDFGDGVIFAIANLDEGLDDEGQSRTWWEPFADEWDGKSSPLGQAPEGLLKPERGFGHIWGTHSEVWARLGWATHAEEAGQGGCELDSDGWRITFADDFSARLEHPPAPEPEPEPVPGELLPFFTDWVWLPTLNMPLNLAFVAFVNEEGRCQFEKHDMVLALPDADTEFVREELRRRCKPFSS